MTCYDGFGNLADGKHPIWIGDFNGNGRADVFFFYYGDKNWWLGSHQGPGGQIAWSLVGNTAGFGSAPENCPVWIGNFSRHDRAEVLFYSPPDGNWWLGTHDGNRLNWSFAGNTNRFDQLAGLPFWVGNFSRADRAEVLFYQPGDGNWWLGSHDGTQLSWSLVGNTGRPYSSFLRLHTKILTTPNTAIDTMIARMREVYATADIRVDLASTENLTAAELGAANFTTLNDLDVGQCRRGATSDEQNQLFQNQNNVPARQRNDEVVVYFVRSVTAGGAVNGCASFPQGRPGAAVAQTASQWTLAHEVGHVLGLNHISGEHQGCPTFDPACCSTPDSTRLMTGCSTQRITGTPTFDQNEITTMTNSNLTRPC